MAVDIGKNDFKKSIFFVFELVGNQNSKSIRKDGTFLIMC